MNLDMESEVKAKFESDQLDFLISFNKLCSMGLS